MELARRYFVHIYSIFKVHSSKKRAAHAPVVLHYSLTDVCGVVSVSWVSSSTRYNNVTRNSVSRSIEKVWLFHYCIRLLQINYRLSVVMVLMWDPGAFALQKAGVFCPELFAASPPRRFAEPRADWRVWAPLGHLSTTSFFPIKPAGETGVSWCCWLCTDGVKFCCARRALGQSPLAAGCWQLSPSIVFNHFNSSGRVCSLNVTFTC